MLNVICLKHGVKYDSVYVNKLYNMIQRNLTISHNFICFTDDPAGINPSIEIKLLPNLQFEGWWWKPYIFKHDHFCSGDINLFFDLDMVIIKNIDHLATYLPEKFVGLRDVGRVFVPDIKKLGSAVMKWPAGQFSNVWTNLENNVSLCKRFRGDQDWIWYEIHNQVCFFPDDWIRSYKWEIRSRNELTDFGPNSTFSTIKDPYISPNTSVLAFHGNPKIHNISDPVIVNNWQ